jgi:hypothetical protein
MRIKRLLITTIVILPYLFCTTTKNQVQIPHSERNMSTNQIFPEIVSVNLPIVTIQFTGSQYGVVAITKSGEIYALKSLTTEPFFKKVKSIEFKEPCECYFSSPKFPYICGTGIRDYQILDLNQNTVSTQLISCDGNEKIFISYLFGSRIPMLFLTVEHVGWGQADSYEDTYLYDFNQKNQNKVLSGYYSSALFQLSDTLFLRLEIQRNHLPQKWQIFESSIQTTSTNDLSDTLNKLGFGPYISSVNSSKNMLICEENKEPFRLFSISWDSHFKNVKVVPWTFQQPKQYIPGKDYCFSQDGNWLRNTAAERSNLHSIYNVFYYLSDKYPGNVSIPIFGLEAIEFIPGAFLDTPEWGTVYVDISRGLDGILMVYKMRDVMAKIVERAKEMR